MAFNSYLFTSGTSWVVPPGVTAIQVECYGSTPGPTSGSITYTRPTAEYPGASYSKSTSIAVTPGQIVYFNVGSSGGNTWFNTTNAAPTSSSSTSSACLAVGGNTASASQIAANCGDIKYKGGAGQVTTGTNPVILTAQGGAAGPNGNGAGVGDPYSNTAKNVQGINYLRYTGGGGNGGSQGGLGVIPYGRSGSGTAGMGTYISGADTGNYGTIDYVGYYLYFGNIVTNTYLYPNGVQYGSGSGFGGYASGGGRVVAVGEFCCCGCGTTYYQMDSVQGQIVITPVTASQKSILYMYPDGTYTASEHSFTLPSDFGSLISLEAFGSSGSVNSISQTGGGGGAYAKTNASSVTASMVAGSTVVYYFVGSWTTYSSGSYTGAPSYINIGASGAPSSVATGVYAAGGTGGNLSTAGGVGGSSSSSIGDIRYSGGDGGNTTRTDSFGGQGGPAGPGGSGGKGGNGFATTNSRGGGGGGAIGGGFGGSNGTSTQGGSGGSITGGTGGTGATSTTNGTAGTNGGGGGGGYSNTRAGGLGGVLNNSLYALVGGNGGGGGVSGVVSGGVYNVTTQTFGGVVFNYVPNANATAALTGAASSASGGTLSPSQTLTQALSGGSATASTGTLTNSQTLTQALSGRFATASAGIFSPSNDQVVNLNSASIAAYSGTLTNSQTLEVALTGVSVAGQTSSFPIFLELVGAEVAGTTGLFGYINTGWQPINTSGGASNWTDIDTQQT